MGEFSLTHILIIAVLLLIFFGPSRLPQFGQSLGKAIRGFKSGLNEIDVDAKDVHDTPKANPKGTEQLNVSQTETQQMAQQKAEHSEVKKS